MLRNVRHLCTRVIAAVQSSAKVLIQASKSSCEEHVNLQVVYCFDNNSKVDELTTN